MNDLARSLRLAARGLARSPGFAVTAVLLLALGVGANAAIYKLIDAVLLHPLPVTQPDRLVESGARVSYPDFQDLARDQHAFSGMAAFESMALKVGRGERTRLLTADLVTAGYFPVLGVKVARGRAFLPGEDQAAAGAVAVLSDDCWHRTFGRDRAVLGKVVTLNDQAFTVVGVAPPGFRGTHLKEPIDLWLPLSAEPRVATGFLAGMDLFHQRKSRWLHFVARLGGRLPRTAAQAQVDLFTRRWEREQSFPRGRLDTPLVPIRAAAAEAESRSASVRLLGLLAAVVGAVLLIACSSLSNLMLVRAMSGTRDAAVRLALGASRRAMLVQLLAEPLLLAGLGGALAVLVASWAMRAIIRFELPGRLPIDALGLGVDPALTLFALALALAAGLGCGLLAALYLLRESSAAGWMQQRGSAGPGHSRLRAALLALQITLALPLLIGAGLLLRSVRSAMAADLGFRHDKLALAVLDLGALGYEKARARELYATLLDRLRADPRARASSLVLALPLGSSQWRVFPRLEGYSPPPGQEPEAFPNVIGADYFRALDVPVLRGRAFTAGDVLQSSQVAVINETMALRFWPGQDPIGKRITPFPGQMDLDLTVVGVVRDTRSHELREEPVPVFYVSFSQRLGQSRLLSRMYVLARTAADPADLLPALQQEIHALDRNLPRVETETFDDHLAQLLSPQRFGFRLMGSLGLLCLALSCVGIFGAVAVAVRSRSLELAVHIVLGAGRAEVRRRVLAQVLAPVAVGLAAGIALALATTRLLGLFLFNVSSHDPTTFALAAASLLAAAAAASYPPARRAGRIDPMIALRQG